VEWLGAFANRPGAAPASQGILRQRWRGADACDHDM